MKTSNCCGTECSQDIQDLGICPTCHEHCDFECDHEWDVRDNSFDHAFGTKHFPKYEVCLLCDVKRDYTHDDDYQEYDEEPVSDDQP